MEEVEKQLTEYRQNKANILGPAINISELSQFHKIVIDSVLLSIHPEDGDVYQRQAAYKGKSAKFAISGKGLQRLAICAGVAWNPAYTKVTSVSHKYVSYMATGCIRKADGQQVCYQAEADMDIDVVIDEINEQFKQKKKNWETEAWFKKLGQEGQGNYISAATTKEINFRKKHKMKIVATDARSRVIRPLLMLQKTYTTEELLRPFVSPRVILSPDYNDPAVKKMMLAAAIQAQTNIFGPAEVAQITEETQTIIDVGTATPDRYTAEDQLPPVSPRASSAKAPSTEETFDGLQEEEQQAVLLVLAKSNNYDVKSLPTSIENMDARNRTRFFLHLSALNAGEGKSQESSK